MGKTQAPEACALAVRISLSRAALARLDEAASDASVTREGLIAHILEDWLADDEFDRELVRIAEERLEDPNDEAIPWEQAKAELGL